MAPRPYLALGDDLFLLPFTPRQEIRDVMAGIIEDLLGDIEFAPSEADEEESVLSPGEDGSAPGTAEAVVGSLGKASSAPRAEDDVGSVGQSGLPAAEERELRLAPIELIANTQYTLARETKVLIVPTTIVPATQVGVG
jgi:hypothetical protein